MHYINHLDIFFFSWKTNNVQLGKCEIKANSMEKTRTLCANCGNCKHRSGGRSKPS